MTDENPDPTNLLTDLLGHLPPVTAFEDSWDFLAPINLFGPTGDREWALTDLRKRHSDESLLQTGVAVINGQHTLALAPELHQPGSRVIALQQGSGRKLFAFLTSQGCLPRTLLPIECSLRDLATRRRCRKHGFIYLVSTVEEVARLTALRVPATLSHGLERRSGWLLRADRCVYGPDCEATQAGQDQVYSEFVSKHMSEAYADAVRAAEKDAVAESEDPAAASYPTPTPAPSPASRYGKGYSSPNPPPEAQSTSRTPWRPYCVVLGCSLSDFSPSCPEQPRQMLQYWSRLREHMDFRLDGLRAWSPSPSEAKRLCFLLAERQTRDLRKHLLEAGKTFRDFDKLFTPPVAATDSTFLEARAALTAAIENGSVYSPRAVAMAIANYNAVVDRELVTPLLEQALASSRPVLRDIGVTLAEVTAQIHRLWPSIYSLGALAKGGQRASLHAERGSAVNDYVRLIGAQAKLIDTFERARRNGL